MGSIADFDKRTYLNASRTPIVSVLSGLTSLTELHLEATQVANITPLNALAGLESPNINDTTVNNLGLLQ